MDSTGVNELEAMTTKALNICKDILKDFHDEEALAVLDIAKILVKNEF